MGDLVAGRGDESSPERVDGPFGSDGGRSVRERNAAVQQTFFGSTPIDSSVVT
jgi:hypothetical protein